MRKRATVKYKVVLPDAYYERILLTCGGRSLIPGPGEFSSLASLLLPGTKLIHGACPYGGADLFCQEFAEGLGFIPIQPFEADWDKHGKAAGPLRNRDMIAYLRKEQKPCSVLAFKGGSGTADMIRQAKYAGVQVLYG